MSRKERQRRAKALDAYKRWLRDEWGVTLDEICLHGAEYTAYALAMYGIAEFKAGGTRGEYVAAINAVVDLHRGWRRAMTEAWDVVSEWTLREPVRSRVPVPKAALRAALTLACCLRWTAFDLYLALGWCAALRPSELLRLRRRGRTTGS